MGSLEIVDIRDALYSYPFEAISYVWGSDKKDCVITIDGKTLPITTSLRDALHQTRYKNKRRALWADSICINQSDNREKAYQVGMMGRIYETSNCTLICIGINSANHSNTSEEHDAAPDVLESCKAAASLPDDARATVEWQKSWSIMLQQAWFKRGWVIQEAALGPQCYLIWGSVEIPWDEFLQGYRCYVLSGLWNMPAKLSPLHYNVTTTLSMLHYNRRQELTDPKDRIYAFMSLPTSDRAMPALEPKYGKDTSHLDVYQDFAVKYLEKNGDLDLLSFVEQRDDTPGESSGPDPKICSFPSWVPRWDCGRDVQSWFDPTHRKIMEYGTSQVTDRAFFVLSDENKTLRVKALVFDSIKYVSQELVRSCAASAAVDQVISIWNNLAEQSAKLPASSPHKDRLGSAFLDALGVGAHIGDKAEWLKSQEAFAGLLESEQLDSLDRQNKDASRVPEFVTDKSHHRRIALLGRGYYAITPINAREGDVCAIVNGTRLPLILREVAGNKNYYTVVGPAWVQSRKSSATSGLPMRLGATEECDDWNDWGLQFDEIYLR